MTHAIHILNASAIPDQRFGDIGRKVEDVFQGPVMTEPFSPDLARAYDGSRGQHNSTALLSQVLEFKPNDSAKFIAVVDADLYIPVLTFVFGEAQFSGSAAVVSTHRLSNQFYGMQRDDELLMRRLEKEIVHELGHLFGLYHCHQFECVMRSSTYVEEIDLKKPVPCKVCQTFLVTSITTMHREKQP